MFVPLDIGPDGPVTVPAHVRSYFSQHGVDLVVMSPPWGGPDYSLTKVFEITKDGIVNGFRQLAHALSFARSVVYILPKNTSVAELRELSSTYLLPCHVYDIMLGNKIKMKVAFFGVVFI
jgi:hypothetical protein